MLLDMMGELSQSEHRDLVGNFVKWCGENHLQLNAVKTKEMVVDFRRNKPPPVSVCIDGTDIDITNTWMWCWTVNWSGP